MVEEEEEEAEEEKEEEEEEGNHAPSPVSSTWEVVAVMLKDRVDLIWLVSKDWIKASMTQNAVNSL